MTHSLSQPPSLLGSSYKTLFIERLRLWGSPPRFPESYEAVLRLRDCWDHEVSPPGSGTAHQRSFFTRGVEGPQGKPLRGVLRTTLNNPPFSPRVFTARDERTQTRKETPHG